MSVLFHDIVWHGKVDLSLVIIPFQVDATICLAPTVFNNVVSFFPEGVIEVLKVAFADILDPKIINRQVEPYQMGFVSPLAGGVRLFKLSVL